MGTHVSPSASLMLEKHAEKTKFLFIVKVNTKVIFRHSCHVPSLEALNFLQNLQTILFEFHSKKKKNKKILSRPLFFIAARTGIGLFFDIFRQKLQSDLFFFLLLSTTISYKFSVKERAYFQGFYHLFPLFDKKTLYLLPYP